MTLSSDIVKIQSIRPVIPRPQRQASILDKIDEEIGESILALVLARNALADARAQCS